MLWIIICTHPTASTHLRSACCVRCTRIAIILAMADSTQTEKPSLGAGGVGLTMLELDMSGADDEQLVSQIAAPPADPGLAYRRKQRVGAIAGVALIVLVAAGVAVAVLVSGSSSPSLTVPEVRWLVGRCGDVV